MKSSRWLYFMSTLAALTVAACNSADSDASTVPTATSTAVTVDVGTQLDFVPDTAWERVLARIDDGANRHRCLLDRLLPDSRSPDLGNELGTVVIVPFLDIFPGTPEYDALIQLLELALSRL
jgi:hypothetical protein